MSNQNIYAIIGPIKIDGISAQHPDMISGFPMPTAVAGLAYKIALDVSDANEFSLKSSGASVIVHDHSRIAGHAKHPVENFRKINDGANIIEELKARAVVSFAIRFEVEGEVEYEDIAHEINRRVPSLYFSGGKVFPMKAGVENVRVCPEFQIIDELAHLPAGHILLDRHDLIQRVINEGKDSLDALLDLIQFHSLTSDGNERAVYVREYPGWLVPLLVGYQAIETPRSDRPTRTDTAIGHVYAESIYSVGEFKSLRSLLASDKTFIDRAFWRHQHNTETSTYYVSAV